MVKAVWSDSTLLIPDDAQGNLIRKLSTLKNQTILWLRNKKKIEQAEILSIELELELYQKQKLQNTSRMDLDYRIFCLEEARKKLLRDDKERWRLKSRLLWLVGGDKNTSFFH
jgi:hypothetical protein